MINFSNRHSEHSEESRAFTFLSTGFFAMLRMTEFGSLFRINAAIVKMKWF